VGRKKSDFVTLLNKMMGTISNLRGLDLLLRMKNEGYIGRKKENKMH
jgi:hypothetical protein